jgi:outer membrane protein assembly factor BamA
MDEFLYLSELKSDKIVTLEQVDKACQMLTSKKRFNNIDIDISDFGAGKHLLFKLTANWIFGKLKFEGIWFGKQRYTSLYTQQPGDVFDSTLHEESVKSIKKCLHDQGYFGCKIEDELIYNKKYKSIDARIEVDRGKRFIVKAVDFTIDKQKYKNLGIFLKKKFGNSLANSNYTKKSFRKQAKGILNFLSRKGFVSSRIVLKRVINLKKHTLDLIFNIKMGMRKTIKFEGNRFFTEDKIKEDFIGFDQPEWLFSPDVISEQLKYEYYKKGYWNALIEYQKKADQGYLFSIQEGLQVELENVEVKDYKTHIPEASNVFWEDLLNTGSFDQDKLETGIDKLRNFYLFQGFWDFKVVDRKFVRNSETKAYTVQIFIDKGIQRFWGGVEVEKILDREINDFFKKYLPISEDQPVPFDLNWLYEQRAFLLNYCKKLGFWYAQVEPDLFELDKATQGPGVTVFVRWKIALGEKIKFGKVLVRGNSRLSFKDVLKEIKFREGDDWSGRKIELTRRKLKSLDIFKTVQIQPYQMSKNVGEKPIIVSLVDDDPVEFRLRAGYFITSKNFLFKNQSTPKLGSSLILKNPLNKADRFSLDFDWTRFERKFDTQYQLPSFLGYPAMTKIKGYANKYIQPRQVGKTDPAYTALQTGFLFGLNDEYKACYHWGINVGNEWMTTKNVHGYLDLSPDLIGKSVPYLFIEPSLVIDKLDDRLNPKKGCLSFLSLKMMAPEKIGIASARLQAEQSIFYPFYKDFVFGARVRFGHVFRRDFQDIMPIERFYLGGPYSVRGYEIDSLPPLGLTEKNEKGEIIKQETVYGVKDAPPPGITREYTIQGGSSMINANLEIRVPILNNLYGAVFQDVGALSQTGLSGFKVWFPTSGVGFRYKTPIGSIRFDVGWKWKKNFYDEGGYGWYLVIGEAF